MSIAASLLLAAASPYADLSTIDVHVAQFTGAPIGGQGGAILPVDRRLRLKSCRSPLAMAWHTERRDTVVVQCVDPGGWRLYVPVKSARIALAEKALPAINRGDAVTIAVSGDGFSVAQPGAAMEPGAVGTWIRVRPAGKIGRSGSEDMRARVIRPGLVEIPLR